MQGFLVTAQVSPKQQTLLEYSCDAIGILRVEKIRPARYLSEQSAGEGSMIRSKAEQTRLSSMIFLETGGTP